ncbi:MAG: DEAD/DEAH box helicase family protein [Anaerolineae bacterium]
MPTLLTPEQQAREAIDRMLEASGWQVQTRQQMNRTAAPGVAVCEFPLTTGEVDYMLFAQGRPIGVVEAKPAGTPLSGVEPQAMKYCEGLPDMLRPLAWHDPLPFRYESTGVETYFADDRDPDARSRRVFTFHRPETLVEWVSTVGARHSPNGQTIEGMVEFPQPSLPTAVRGMPRPYTNANVVADPRAPYSAHVQTLRSRLRTMPPLITTGLWPAQIRAIHNLEASLAQDRPRALIQMATGSGKTYTAVSFVYRLIKHAGANRVLFMVDRNNLGKQAFNEFAKFTTPDDGRKFTELYNVQHMQSNVLDPVSKVCITTVQRLFSMLSDEPELPPELEDRPLHEVQAILGDQPREVVYNPNFPIEYFDFIVIDECHRSIYNVWRQVLEYFDAYLIGLTATPAKQTFGFFNQNLVMEYTDAQAVIDGVNVDGWVYRIRTQITEAGSTVEAGEWVGKRDRKTREERWEQLDEDLDYAGNDLDRQVQTPDQIRTVLQTYRDRLPVDIFPGRDEVPKTLIFAKDDNHAEEITRIAREVFGKGDAFCQKITYKVTGRKPSDLINDFRNSYNPRIAVTVDMIATGTDVRPLEVLLFMRNVNSANFFRQMRGRGTRVVSETELQSVTPSAQRKTHFVLVDAVGVVEHPKIDAGGVDRKRSLSLANLLERFAFGIYNEDDFESLAVRLSRLDPLLTDDERMAVKSLAGGKSPRALAASLLDAINPDVVRERAEALAGPGVEPTPEHRARAQAEAMWMAAEPFNDPDLRQQLQNIQQRTEMTIDTVSVDTLIDAGYSEADTERAREMTASFRAFLEANCDEITALQLLFDQPYRRRELTLREIEDLKARIEQPPHVWTTESLWRAYAQLEKDKVRGVRTERVLTDLVSLVRHAVQLDDELIPYPERVQQRYADWLAAQEASGKVFTEGQRWWLDRIAEAIGVNLTVTARDFQYGELFQRGGWRAAQRAFGDALPALLDALNHALL